MKSITSTLNEKVTLLTNSGSIDKTTVDRFAKMLKTRASIRTLGAMQFEIITHTPPAKLKNVPIVAIEWNNAEYVYTSPILEYKNSFLKGRVKFWRSKSVPQRD